MSDIPDEAVQRAAEVMFRQYESQYDASHLTWRDFAADARAVLEAAGRTLAGHIGARILRYSDEHEPQPGSPGYLAWHQHFTAAAEVATSAFGEG